MKSLVSLEPARERNARLWDANRADPPITPVGEVRNAATLEDARRSAGMSPHLAHREDVRAAFVAGREAREAQAAVPPKETTMNPQKREARRERLREYLEKHGPTDRKTLMRELAYDGDAGRFTLNGDLAAIGAGPTKRFGRVVALGAQVEPPIQRPQITPEPVARQPLRPSLADDAIRYVREGAEGPGVLLPAEYCQALAARLAEAGL